MDHVPIFLEHVDLLNSLDWLHIEFFQRSLQLLIVGAGGFMNFLHFSPRRAFTTVFAIVLASGGEMRVSAVALRAMKLRITRRGRS